MRRVGSRAAVVAWVLAPALMLALPLFGGYLFTDRVLWAALPAMVCVLAACVAWAAGARSVRAGLGRAAWPLAGFIAWSVIATVRSVYLHASLVAVVSVSADLGLLALFAALFRDERRRRWAWAVLAGAATVEGILGLRDWTQTVIFGGDIGWRIFGTMYNPNVLAGYLVAAAPAALVALAWAWRNAAQDQERPRLGLIAAGFALLIPCAALLLTGSRAGLLGAMLGAGVIVLAAPTRIPRRRLALAAVALVALMVLAPPVRNRLLSATTQSHSAIFRWYTWQGTARMIAARPLLGFGPGTFESAYPRFAQVGFTRMAHQTPLQIAAEAGLPALLLLAAGVALIGGRLVAGLRAGGLRALEAAAGLGALTAVGLQNLADYTWYVPAVGMTLAATVGLALAAARDGDSQEDQAVSARRPWLAWACAALALLALIGCAIGLQAQMLAAGGRAAMAQGRYTMAASLLRRATRVDPLDAEIVGDLSDALGASGSLRSAVTERLRAAELEPTEAGNYLALSTLYEALGEADSALASAQRAVELHPTSPQAYARLGRLQEQEGLDEKALQTWRELERIWESPVGRYPAVDEVTDYSYAYAWLGLARDAEERGDVAAARTYYERAAALTGEFARKKRDGEEMLRLTGMWDEREVVEAERLRDEAEAGLRRLPDAGEGTG